MRIDEIWRANLDTLVRELGRGDHRMAYRIIAKETGLNEEYVYQLHARSIAAGKPRNIGPRAARRIAEAFAEGRPASWFDQLNASAVSAPKTAAESAEANLMALADLARALPQATRETVAVLVGNAIRMPHTARECATAISALVAYGAAGVETKDIRKPVVPTT